MLAGAAAVFGLCSLFAVRIVAQSESTPWGSVVNVSKSGAASQPVIAAAPDGTLHVMWWDATEGEQYSHTTNVSDTTWTQPAAISAIFGSRKIDFETGREILAPPRAARLVATTSGGVHAMWIDAKDQLSDIAIYGTSQGAGSTPLAESALDLMLHQTPAARCTGHVHPEYSPGRENISGQYGTDGVRRSWFMLRSIFDLPNRAMFTPV
jgi:hypothetical protein